MSKTFFFGVLILGLTLPLLSLSQSDGPVLTGPPETAQDFQKLGQTALGVFPEALKQALTEALALWWQLLDWIKGLTASWGFEAETWWQRIQVWVQERAAIFQSEFPKEKLDLWDDIKEIIPQLLKNIWGFFRH